MNLEDVIINGTILVAGVTTGMYATHVTHSYTVGIGISCIATVAYRSLYEVLFD